MLKNLFEGIGSLILRFFRSRTSLITTIMIAFSAILFGRIFYLQIIMGDDYQKNHVLQILKTKKISATRGSIYDRNGNLLAYDKLAYAVTFEDTGDYSTNDELNEALLEVIGMIEENGDSIDNNFNVKLKDGEFSFKISGTSLDRFRADVYGHTYVDDLSAKESISTAEDVFYELCDRYGIFTDGNSDMAEKDDTIYPMEDAMKLVIVRYEIAANQYQKYIETNIASDVSEETVAMIKENSDHIHGADIAKETVRVYNNSEYFAHIIGYTGTISTEEYDELSKERDDYVLNDSIGKSGIEKYCETTLQGVKGEREVYVDNVGTLLEVRDETDPQAGGDVYLTIDQDLQIAVYNMLEEELASILYSKISDIDGYEISGETSASDIVIPVNDVYFALLNNNVIDIGDFSKKKAGSTEKSVYKTYASYEDDVKNLINKELTKASPTPFNDCDDELQDYENYIMDYLYTQGTIDQESVDVSSDQYQDWKNGDGSLKEYLKYNISTGNVDTSLFEVDEKYADLDEIYSALVDNIMKYLDEDKEFHKLIYKYLIENKEVSGYEICKILYEQNILKKDSDKEALENGTVSAYTFIKKKIKNLDITPAQLALDPCNASSVVVDPNNGEVFAMVTYPGYDNNKLANSVDSDYYSSLTEDKSYPLLNYATQQKTAPGSTFKMVTATAALTEGYVSTTEKIKDKGKFENIDPSPSCWIYPASTHGKINVSEAIRDSCNYFFYEMGYRMSTASGSYNDDAGLKILSEYASAYGLDSKTGIETSESSPQISDEDAVRSSIGQGTNNYTTSELARYVATVANSGTCYNLSLILKTQGADGGAISEFEPEIYNELSKVSSSSWNAIHKGMKMVVDNLDAFDDVDIEVAGKTGTAQEVKTRPNHALFVCYAPYNKPEVAVATRIPYGYTSGNAAEVTSSIISYYFNLEDLDDISEKILDAGGNTFVND